MKSGSDLVSCFINHFKDMGYFSGTTFVELTICEDNCVVKKQEQYYYLLYYLDSRDRSISSCNIVIFY